MPDTVVVVLIAAGCALGTGALGVLALWWPRRRTLRTTVLLAALTAVASVVAGVLGTARAMFLSGHDRGVVLIVCAVAGLAAVGVTLLAARQLTTEAEHLQRSISAPAANPATSRRRPHSGVGRTVELIALRQALETARRQQVVAEQSRRELVSWVSHDLRTPLAGLRALAEALEDGVADDEDAYRKQIRREVERLSSLVDDLFELSRVQASPGPTHRATITVRDLLSDAVAATEPLARNASVTIAGDAADELTVMGDEAALHRAVVNLLANAITHTPAGGSVRVTGTGGGGTVRVEVRDGCGGIPEADLPRLFEVGWRGEAQRGTRGGGLGLAIVDGIAAAHQGSVGVTNVDGGCAIALDLPT